jgi:ankyrin repeat protein
MKKLSFTLSLLVITTALTFAQNLNEELLAAVKRSDAAAVKSLIAKGADVNAKTNYDATPLHFAADRGNLEVVKALVEAGANVEAKDTFYKFTPVTMAMMHQRKEVVAYLQEVLTAKKNAASPAAPSANETKAPAPKTPANIDPAHNEALLAAAKQGELAAVKELLAKNADVNAKTRYNLTPLMLAAEKGHLEVVKVLLAAGADLNVVDSFYKSRTALNSAANGGHAEIVRLLLEKGANSKEAALFTATFADKPAVVKTVLELGGFKPETLDQALRNAEENERANIAEMLRNAGAKPLARKTLKPEIKIEAATLQRYVGTYRLDEARQYTFIIAGGKLSGWDVRQYSFPLTAIEPNIFRLGNDDSRTITFNEENGKVVSITLNQGGFKQNYNRVEGK